MRRPSVSNNLYGHICLDNFQFTPVTTSPPIGALDSVVTNGAVGAYGWSVDPDNTSASNFVDCYVDTVNPAGFIGRVTANNPSPDLPQYPGSHRFSMSIPSQYRDGNQHQMYCFGIDVTGGDSPAQLTGSPKTFRFNTPIGSLDVVDADGYALGWSQDLDLPAQPNTVHFYIDGVFAGETIANLPRPDITPGNHGFRYYIPAQYRDNQQHTINAYGIDLTGDPNKLLPGSPKTFTLSPKIMRVSYELIATDDLPINTNPNVGGGLRIFPDKKNSNDTINRAKIRVRAKYSSNTAGVRIYFRNFDLDDPSTVDPDDTNGWDNNEEVEGFPNTPIAGVLTIPAGSAGQGCIAYPTTVLDFSNIVSCPTNSEGEAVVDLTVTMRPGDNFTVAASTNNENYMRGINVYALNLKDSSNTQIPVTTTALNACQISSGITCRADMLTVWRRLHIEFDSMREVEGNKVEGTFTESRTVPPGEVTLAVNTSKPLEFYRFQNGRMVIGNASFKIKSNLLNSVKIENPTPFNIVAGQPFIIYDDDDFNDDEGEFFLNGDEGDNITE